MDENERLRRWRLVLGGDSGETLGASLAGEDRGMDGVLAALYGGEKDNKNVGHGGSLPHVTRWLGDIRTYFPSPVVRVMQKDALDRLGLQCMLLEPEMLEAVEPDVHLVATLISLGRVIPEKTKDSARRLVRKVVEALERRLARATEQAVRGAPNRAARTCRPRLHTGRQYQDGRLQYLRRGPHRRSAGPSRPPLRDAAGRRERYSARPS